MNRILKVIFYIIVLSLLYLWMSTVFDSCGKDKQDIVEETENTLDDVLSSGDDEITDLSDLTESDEDEFEGEEVESKDVEEINDDLTAPIEEEEEIVETPAPRTEYRSYDSSPYLIVAGSFSQESNANTLVDKLRRMGYNDAEKAIFDGSKFYSVIAERHTDYELALNKASALKSRGVDCYVHKRK